MNTLGRWNNLETWQAGKSLINKLLIFALCEVVVLKTKTKAPTKNATIGRQECVPEYIR